MRNIEMVDHMSTLRELFAHFLDLPLSMAGLEDRESLFTHTKNEMIITENSRFGIFWPFSRPRRRRTWAMLFGSLGWEIWRAGWRKPRRIWRLFVVFWNLGRLILGYYASFTASRPMSTNSFFREYLFFALSGSTPRVLARPSYFVPVAFG